MLLCWTPNHTFVLSNHGSGRDFVVAVFVSISLDADFNS